jgi:hypothetical protein
MWPTLVSKLRSMYCKVLDLPPCRLDMSPCEFTYSTPRESAKGMQIQVGQRHEGHCGAGFTTAALTGFAQGILQLVRQCDACFTAYGD